MGPPPQSALPSMKRRTYTRFQIGSWEEYQRLLSTLTCSSSIAYPKTGGDHTVTRKTSFDGLGPSPAAMELTGITDVDKWGTFKLDFVHKMEEYILGGADGAVLEDKGLGLSIRYSHQQLPVMGLMMEDDDDCDYVVGEIVKAPSPTYPAVEIQFRQEPADSHDVPYLLKDANVISFDPAFAGNQSALSADNARRTKESISSNLVKETMTRAQINAVKVLGSFHTLRHTFLCVLPMTEPTDGVTLTLDHHFISHGNPLGFYVGVPTPYSGFVARLLEYVEIKPVSLPVPMPSMLLPALAKPPAAVQEPLIFRREEGWMEEEQNESFREGTEYDLAGSQDEDEKKKKEEKL